MTMTIDLSPEVEEGLKRLAREKGVDAPTLAKRLIESAVTPVEDEEGSRIRTGAELVEYWRNHGLIGDWADRTDIGDSVEYARKLREQAQNRDWD